MPTVVAARRFIGASYKTETHMANAVDLKMIASRLQEAADRVESSSAGLKSQATMTDLIVTAPGADGGHGQGRTESIPFGVLFHDPVDRLGDAIDRIEAYCNGGWLPAGTQVAA